MELTINFPLKPLPELLEYLARCDEHILELFHHKTDWAGVFIDGQIDRESYPIYIAYLKIVKNVWDKLVLSADTPWLEPYNVFLEEMVFVSKERFAQEVKRKAKEQDPNLGEYLAMLEITTHPTIHLVNFLVCNGVFSTFLNILEHARAVRKYQKLTRPYLSYALTLFRNAYLLQKTSREPLLVLALREYYEEMRAKSPQVEELFRRLLRRYQRLDGNTPFIRSCRIAMGERLKPRSRTEEILLSRKRLLE